MTPDATGPQPGSSETVYDLRGLKCPLPVLKTRKKLTSLPAKARLWVETTDPMAVIDIPHFCAENGHRLVSSETLPDNAGNRFLIEKDGALS